MANNSQTSAKKSPVLVIIIIAVIVLLGGSLLWWRYVYSSPQRVFQGMLNNSMRLQGISKKVDQKDTDKSIEQITQYQYGPETRVLSLTRLTQHGDSPAVVVTQTVGTPTRDYTRYVSIDTNQKKANGQRLDFSNILGVWGDSKASNANKTTDGQLYAETVLGVIPFGNLTQPQRHDLMDFIRKQNVYEVDYKTVARSIDKHRPVYTYQVTVDAVAYVTMLKQFAQTIGLNNLNDLDPAQYAGQERMPFTISIDVWSRQVKRIMYGNGGRTEEFSGYNALKPVEIPQQAITIEELQSRLQALQQ